MPPRPHLAFRGRFDLRSSLRIGGVGATRPATDNAAATQSRPPRGRLIRSAIVAGEVGVFLAIAFLVVRRTTDPRQSSWTLLAVFLSLLGLSLLRRRAFPAGPAD